MTTLSDKKGFTLIESLTALAIIGFFMLFFYTLFFLNWQACEQFLAQAEFGQEMDQIMGQIAGDGRYSVAININNNANMKQVDFTDPNGNVSKYTMNDNGQLTIAHGQEVETITDKLDFADSSFVQDNQAIVVKIVLSDEIFGYPVALATQTEIYSRNWQ
jgi:prepilin-type N-terminal cleavage/methylation domain-containing protein